MCRVCTGYARCGEFLRTFAGGAEPPPIQSESRAAAHTEREQSRRQCRVRAEPPPTQWVCIGKFWGQARRQVDLKSTLLAHV
ncbi:MAG: hypothetical protein RSF00_05030 [Oscillospiraceae bacterium]